MNPIVQAANMLSDASARLRSLVGQLSMPESNYTLESATQKLAGVLPSASHKISMVIWNFGDGPVVSWEVWDGKKSYEAKSLDGAVNACLAAHTPAPEKPLEEAQALLQGAMPLEF